MNVPRDMYGNGCGIDDPVKGKPYLFYFDIRECIDVTVPFLGCRSHHICLKKCPDIFFQFNYRHGKVYNCDNGPKEVIHAHYDYDPKIYSNCANLDGDVGRGTICRVYSPSKPSKFQVIHDGRCIWKIRKQTYFECLGFSFSPAIIRNLVWNRCIPWKTFSNGYVRDVDVDRKGDDLNIDNVFTGYRELTEFAKNVKKIVQVSETWRKYHVKRNNSLSS